MNKEEMKAYIRKQAREIRELKHLIDFAVFGPMPTNIMKKQREEAERKEDEALTELLEGKMKLCGRCYGNADPLYPANCQEKPELLAGKPIGQYHCPDCGAMVLAGMKHPDMCKRCIDRAHPEFDKRPK